METIFSKRLKELRINFGLSQSEISKYLNITQPSYYRWEKATAEPDIYKLSQLSKLFEVSIDYLIGNENEEGNIIVQELELPADERQLLDNYRTLPNELKANCSEYVKTMKNLNNQINQKKQLQ